MKIAIGCDHAAYQEKSDLLKFLKSELGCDVLDMGTNSSDSVDYAEYGHIVGEAVSSKKVDRGIVISFVDPNNVIKTVTLSFAGSATIFDI